MRSIIPEHLGSIIIFRRRIKLINNIGVLLESFLGGIVEIVLFMVLLHNSVDNNLIPVIRAAILGSILANLLLCLGFCFFAGGLFREEQEFDEVVSEVGHGLLLMAGFGLLIPTAFYASLNGPNFPEGFIEFENSEHQQDHFSYTSHRIFHVRGSIYTEVRENG